MKLTILKENLAKATANVTRNVSPKTQLPILSNILLQTENNQLKLASTNLETTIILWVGASIEKEGAFSVPARFFFELVSSFTREKVELELVKQQIKLVCGESEASLSGIEATEFPPLPKTTEKAGIRLNSEELLKSLPFVLIAAAADETRPILTGVKFLTKEGQLHLVATDGFRLSLKKLTVPTPLKDEILVPARPLSELVKMVDSNQKEVELFVSEQKNQIIFSLESAQIATRLIEGEYPAYEKIIPGTCVTQIVFDRHELLQAVKFGAIYARESANILKFTVNAGKVMISANSPQVGENKTTLSVSVEGEPGEIAFNARFLLDMLAVFPGDEVLFEMNGALSPGVFKAPGDDSFLHIIMPVRVQG